jgi:predicted phage terminase large subunit-like protein
LDIDFWKFTPDEIINKTFQKVSRFKPQRVWIEINQYQKMLAQELRKQMRERDAFFVLEEQTSLWNKEAKIKTILQSKYSNYNILHQVWWVWVNELENELLRFPNWKHDDIIDCLSMCIWLFDAYKKPVEYKFQSQWLYNLSWF